MLYAAERRGPEAAAAYQEQIYCEHLRCAETWPRQLDKCGRGHQEDVQEVDAGDVVALGAVSCRDVRLQEAHGRRGEIRRSADQQLQ